jgi:sRNA-binding carbon storage regulator CsrA
MLTIKYGLMAPKSVLITRQNLHGFVIRKDSLMLTIKYGLMAPKSVLITIPKPTWISYADFQFVIRKDSQTKPTWIRYKKGFVRH